MTSTTDTAGHPDVAEISDLSEGLLPPSRTADVRRHLDECVLCADVYDSLEEIRGLLGTLPGPTRMPDDVASRIDAALAAEALLSATAPAREAAEDDRASVSRETSVAGVSHTSGEPSPASLTDRPSGRPHAATGPGRSRRGRRGRRRVVVLGTVFTAAALGLGAILVQSLGDGSGKSPQTVTQQGAKDTFSEGELKTQVAELLAKNRSASTPSASPKRPWGVQSNDAGNGSAGVDTLITPTVQVPDCIQKGTGSNAAILAAQQGTYKGTTVYLVVVPDASDSTKVTAYIVEAACVKQASASPGKLLLTHSYARS
ncbi:anti-sigma factor family protein [Streptomyces sp. NPDC058086]|uniref:anti-sigma factor family protein n=1 Tax=Streptomyces sp. NPDC058086 TaxID=3346334 RepID=UPI0036E0FAE8